MHQKRYVDMIPPAEFHIHHPKSTRRKSYPTSKHSKKPCVLNARVHTSLLYKSNLGSGARGEDTNPACKVPLPWGVQRDREGARSAPRTPQRRSHDPQDAPRAFRERSDAFLERPKSARELSKTAHEASKTRFWELFGTKMDPNWYQNGFQNQYQLRKAIL